MRLEVQLHSVATSALKDGQLLTSPALQPVKESPTPLGVLQCRVRHFGLQKQSLILAGNNNKIRRCSKP